MTGFICINKKVGDSSAYCVNKVKRKLKEKCGHMGTLDPLASGVLPVAIGQATRLFDYLLDKEKTYVASFDFSYQTPSLDLETDAEFYSEIIPTKEQILNVIPSLLGDVLQVPPSFSAKFVDGKRSYKLARQGVNVELPPKKVRIKNIDLLEQIGEASFKFKITCGGGTYIRSIVRDMAKALNCYGTMIALERVKSGVFSIENSVTVDEFLASDNPREFVIPAEKAVNLPELILTSDKATRLLNGLRDKFDFKDGLYKVYNESEFWGIGEVLSGTLKMRTYVRDL